MHETYLGACAEHSSEIAPSFAPHSNITENVLARRSSRQQGTLYVRNAVGGSINLITRKPRTATHFARSVAPENNVRRVRSAYGSRF
jgi:hypothetical protein